MPPERSNVHMWVHSLLYTLVTLFLCLSRALCALVTEDSCRYLRNTFGSINHLEAIRNIIQSREGLDGLGLQDLITLGHKADLRMRGLSPPLAVRYGPVRFLPSSSIYHHPWDVNPGFLPRGHVMYRHPSPVIGVLRRTHLRLDRGSPQAGGEDVS